MNLTRKQQQFVEEYLLDLNATQSAIRAGYKEKTARQIASENLTKPHIAEAIASAMQARSAQAGVDADMVLNEAVEVYREARVSGNLVVALRALELIGKHVDVQAFKERVEVTKVDHAAILEARIVNAERLRGQLN